MSIATKTPESLSDYSPLEEARLLTEGQIDRAKIDTGLSKAGLASVHIMEPDRQERGLAELNDSLEVSEPIERITLLPTFMLFQDIQEAINGSDREIAALRQELAAREEATRAYEEYLEETRLQEKEGLISVEQALNSTRNTHARIEEVQNDKAIIQRQIKGEEDTKAKFIAWQTEVGDKLAKMEDENYLQAITPGNAHPYRAGSLSRTDGTIADRTPR